uniref:Uncharacterized protein n=1 Tax=Rhipicephalus zambeziensis TaxID=60191 RepID=A0A224YWH7_9ACAR
MATLWSSERAFCADYRKRHTKKIAYKRNFRCVKDLNVALLRKRMPEKASSIRETDILCQSCFNRLKLIAVESPDASQSDANFVPGQIAVEELNVLVKTTDVTTLKIPAKVKAQCRVSYAKRKRAEIEGAISRTISAVLTVAYGTTEEPGPSAETCSTCREWLCNLKHTFDTCESYYERCRLLTLLPVNLCHQEIQEMIPSATRHLIRKSRKYRHPGVVKSEPLHQIEVEARKHTGSNEILY